MRVSLSLHVVNVAFIALMYYSLDIPVQGWIYGFGAYVLTHIVLD